MSSVSNEGHSAAQETLPYLFARAVRNHGKKNVIISDVDGSVFTYADVAEVVRRILSKLDDEGIKKGDTICIYAPVNAESFLLFWAAANLGVIFVPLDFRWPEKMLERVLGQVKPKILFCERGSFLGFSTIKEQVRTVLFDGPGERDHKGPPSLSRWLDGDRGEVSVPEIVPDDEAVILYTSGSTGEPKGVVLSHGALYRSGQLVKKLFRWTSDDILLSLGDMHVMSGLRNPAIAALHAGCSFVITSDALRPNLFSLAECIQKYRCTLLSTVPVTIRHFLQFKDRIPTSRLGSLRLIMSAGSFLSQTLLDSFYGHFQIPVLNYYGLTETTGLCVGHSLESFKHAHGSIGLPVGSIAEIVDADGNVLADGATGELRIRSKNLMSGYYNDRELTDKLIRNGWLYTGDLAMKRPDGHIVLMGRIRNIIKNAQTELIYLEEVELALEKHPRVREAAVCGFTSIRGDERMAAFIVPGSKPAHLSDFFKELRQYLNHELGPNKVPAVFFIKDRLPRSSAGKLLREPLKQEIVE